MYGIAMIIAMITIMWKRSDNNSDSDNDDRAEW